MEKFYFHLNHRPSKIKKYLQGGGTQTGGSLKLAYIFTLTVLTFVIGIAEGGAIRDLESLNQSPLSWLDKKTADNPLLSKTEMERLNRESDTRFFAPWHREKPLHGIRHASWGLKKYSDKPSYGCNGKRRSRSWMKKIVRNAHIDDFPQDTFAAISLRNIDFRLLPTAEIHSDFPVSQGKNPAFDNFQLSSAPAGTPLFVTLTSRDKKWALAETDHLIGWVQTADIARVDPHFVKLWENGRYVVIVKDKTPVSSGAGIIFSAHLGAIFPRVGEAGEKTCIWTAGRDPQGKAVLMKGTLPKSSAASKPLLFTAGNTARLASELAGGEYGWGGMAGNRDCSSTVRDLFSPFGILLPRNSIDQAGAGRFISLLGLSKTEKKTIIAEKGVPWRTLLWTPGHIMLYIGIHNGQPLIFHNFWKVAVLGPKGEKRRIVVGKTAITTLFPGRELPNIDPSRANLLSGLAGMVLIGEQNENLPFLPPAMLTEEETEENGP